jgi:hypothetical protein
LPTTNLNYTKLADRNVSFGLIRTNPKLTSNVKLTVDSLGELWLNSIDAVEQLADQKYKRIPISPKSNHETNIFRFYDNGKTPSKISFAVGSSIRTDVMARDLKDQYDFDLYTSGAKYLSADYTEKFSYLAPLYLDKVIPEYFVIFKIPGASNYSTNQWYQKTNDPNFSQTQFAEDLFKNAIIIKSISLKDGSNLGTYLRNIRSNPMYPDYPLYVNFKEDRFSIYRGVSINAGTYVEIPELLDSVLRRGLPQLALEKYITEGFERNNIVHPRILNLEFLFNDDTSTDYSINRYVGFYCNAIDLAKFNLDTVHMYENDADNDNPILTAYTKYDDVSVTLTNSNGVVLRGEGVDKDLSFINRSLTDSDNLMFPYIRSKGDNLHFIRSNRNKPGAQEFSQTGTNIIFAIDDISFDIGKLFGPDTLFSQELAQKIAQDTRTTVLLQLPDEPAHLDTIRLYHQNGSTFDVSNSNGAYDDIVFVGGYFENGEEYSLEYPIVDQILFDTESPDDFFQTTSSSEHTFGTSSCTLLCDDVTGFDEGHTVFVRATSSGYLIGTINTVAGNTLTIDVLEESGSGSSSSWTINRSAQFTPSIQVVSNSGIGSLIPSIGSISVPCNSVDLFEIGNMVKIYQPVNRSYQMAGMITEIDTEALTITVMVDYEYGGLADGIWIVQRLDLGIQYLSEANGTFWKSNGREFEQGAVGSRIYVNLDNAEKDSLTQTAITIDTTTISDSAVYTFTDKGESTDTIDLSTLTNIESALLIQTQNTIVYEAGQQVQVYNSTTAYFNAIVESYDSETGSLAVTVIDSIGTGSFSTWTISLTGDNTPAISAAIGLKTGKIVKIQNSSGRYIKGIVTSVADGQFTVQSRIANGVGDFASGFEVLWTVSDTNKLTTSLTKLIGELYSTHLVSSTYNESLFIQSRAYGNTYGSLGLQNISESSAFLINGKYTTDLVWADGGLLKPQAIVPIGNIERLSQSIDSLVVKTSANWSSIDRVCNSSTYVNNENGETSAQTVADYLKYSALMIHDEEEILIDYNKIEIRNTFNPSIGLLSLFEIKDIDFDTYTSRYATIPEIDLYQYYYIPERVSILDFTQYCYHLIGDGTILVNGIEYEGTGTEPVLIWQDREGLHQYIVTAGNPVVVKTNIVPGQFNNFNLVNTRRTIGDDNLQFAIGDARPIVSNNDAIAMRANLEELQVGLYPTNTNSINLNTVGNQLSLTSIGGIDGLGNYEVVFGWTNGTVLQVFGDSENYAYCSFDSTTYDELTDEYTSILTINEIKSNGSILNKWTVINIGEDANPNFPTYRLHKLGNPFGYMTARLTEVDLGNGTLILTIIDAVNEPVSGPGWLISQVEDIIPNTRLDIGILDEDLNLQSFTGFFGLGANHTLPDQTSPTYEYREKYLSNNLASEYNVYLENFSTDFSTDGRVVPYISKWGMVDSTDARGNAYRLNCDITFGKDNFGPSHRETAPTAEKLTHEWFYIESNFSYLLDPSLVRKNYYYFDSALDIKQLINNPAYFEEYFTYIPKYNESEIDRPQFRYSKLIKNQFTNQYETVFNGAKFIFSELNSRGDVLANTTRFEDYNFSILLKPVKEDLTRPQNPISYRIIENTDAKSILILIEVALSGRDEIANALLTSGYNKNSLKTGKLDQGNLFSDNGYTTVDELITLPVDVIYTTEDSAPGNNAFNRIYSNDSVNLSDLKDLGTAIDQSTGFDITEDFKLSDWKTILVKKGSDETNSQVLIGMPGSRLFDLANKGLLGNICQSGIFFNTNYRVYRPNLSNSKRVKIGPTTYRIARLIGVDQTPSQSRYGILLDSNGDVPIIRIKQNVLSMFGDYRITFSPELVSNLTYAFMYSVKDKKYNSLKSAFSTVKLATGISFSKPDSSNIDLPQYTLIAYNLLKVSDPLLYGLDSFINPISGASLTSTAFAPIMMIDQNQKVSILLDTRADLKDPTTETVINSLHNQRLTGHALKSVSEKSLAISSYVDPLQGLPAIKNLAVGQLTSIEDIVDPDNKITDLSIDYDFLTVQFFSSFGEKYKIGDIVKIENGNLSSGRFTPNGIFLMAKVIDVDPSIGLPQVFYAIHVEVYFQSISDSRPLGTAWNDTTANRLVVLYPTISIGSIGIDSLTINLPSDKYPVEGTTLETWTRDHQQFQLFGGKNYFINLFENLSFANFIKLIETDSKIVSWETYTGGARVNLGLDPETGKPRTKLILIEVEPADQVEKNQIVSLTEDIVETSERAQVGGYSTFEQLTSNYELFRYSGEYEILCKSVAGFKYQNRLGDFILDGSNVRLNPNVANFFVMPEFSYVKYANQNILSLEQSSKFSARYPLIGESPIDYAAFNSLASSWDFGYHYQYFGKSTKTAIAGTNRITEDYSFVSKLINLPLDIMVEPSTFEEITNEQFEVTDLAFANLGIDFAYSIYATDIKLKINLDRLIAKKLISAGLGESFNRFFKAPNGSTLQFDAALLGNQTLDEYKLNYCLVNLVKLYTLDILQCYARPDYTLTDNSASFKQLTYNEIELQGYLQLNTIQINNPKSAILTCSVPKLASTGVSLVPKLKIKYI